MDHTSMDEATALLATLEVTAPDAPTACAGWKAHELVAHLAAGAAEMADLTESVLAGRGDRATRGFTEREAPFIALADDELRDRLVTEALRLNAAVEALARTDPVLSVPFSERRMTASDLVMHGRSEAAIHRWDLVGDDAVGRDLLCQPELTVHAVSVLGTMLQGASESVTARVQAAGLAKLDARFGAPGQPDVVLIVDDDGARLEVDDACTGPTAMADADARLLALWGRRTPTRPVTWVGDDRRRGGLEAFLWPASAAARQASGVNG
jgi:uncharacterized protein (TIGR03083 family)